MSFLEADRRCMPKIEAQFRKLAVWILCAALWTCLGMSARADSSTANLSVSLTDPSGAAIPGARLLLRNSDTSQEQQSKSGPSGSAIFPFLKPGHYQLTVSKEAFADVVVNKIVLNVGDERHLQLSLKVGSAAQTVTVDGSGLTLNTADASVGTVIDRKFVESMPLNGRSFQDLISITPGVTTQSPQSGSGQGSIGATGDFSVNGQRTESNNYNVDGVSANTGAGNGYGVTGAATGGAVASSTALGTTQSLVSVDALQEFRVLSSTYSAEYGRSPGGQFNLLTRSGTDHFHGSAFDYLRNNFFDANDWFNDHYGAKISALRQNDFGGTLGGPMALPGSGDMLPRSFFFVSYEGLRLTQPQAASAELVPDQFLRDQAPSAIQRILNAFPKPTQGGIDYGDASNPSLAQFLESYSVPSQIHSTSLRLDHRFGDNWTAFARAAYTPTSADSRSLSSVSQLAFATQTYTLGVTGQLSPRLTNDFRLGYARSDSKVLQSLDSFGGATPINLAAAVGAGAATAQPVILLDFTGAGFTQLQSGPQGNGLRQWNAIETLSYIAGRHAFKFGMDYRQFASPISPASPQVYALFFSASDALNNAVTETDVLTQTNATPVFRDVAAFAQDEWHMRPTLTLSLGLRWEVNPPPTGANGKDAYTISGTLSEPSSLGIAPRGTPLWKTPWYNFAPRLGVAWQARSRPGWETILRAGGGVFFDTDNQVAADGFIGAGFGATQSYFSVPLPLTPEQTNIPIGISPPYSTVYAFPTHLQLPYTFEWNASVEQALAKSQSFTISYVGSNGRRQLREQELSLSSLNPDFSYVLYFEGGLSSSYNSLQAKFQRSLSHGLQALASYTWSHAIDFGSTYSVLYVLRGNADFDVHNTFSGALSWDAPQTRQGALRRFLLNRWGLDGRFIARSGFPVGIRGNLETDPATGALYYTGADIVPGQRFYLEGSQYPGGRAINPAAFSAPSGAGFGNAPRNFLRGFGESQLNLAVRREFQPQDRFRVQFRAEAFNLLNHPNFGFVDPRLTDATFGQATQMLNQSLGTLAAQYQQGGPRSLQFALKLLF
jgi:Carboxypeptidase regulatory-like domain/TonB dependent receptor-like, beta-barrel